MRTKESIKYILILISVFVLVGGSIWIFNQYKDDSWYFIMDDTGEKSCKQNPYEKYESIEAGPFMTLAECQDYSKVPDGAVA